MIPNFDDIGILIIDVQDKLSAAMPEEVVKDVIHNIDVLTELVQDVGGTVAYTEQYPRGLGSTVETLRSRLSGTMRVEKIAFSCLAEASFLDDVLPELPSDLIVVGMEAHVCVLQTVFDLLAEADAEEIERTLYIPVDAVCSRRKLNWENALDQMVEAGVVATNTETLIFQALREAGTDRFKHFSQRIK